MMGKTALRLLRETDLRLLAKFAYSVVWKGVRAVSRFKRRVARGDYFPAFLFFSVTTAAISPARDAG